MGKVPNAEAPASGLKVNCALLTVELRAFSMIDVRVTRGALAVPLPLLTKTAAVATVLMKTSSYQTMPATLAIIAHPLQPSSASAELLESSSPPPALCKRAGAGLPVTKRVN